MLFTWALVYIKWKAFLTDVVNILSKKHLRHPVGHAVETHSALIFYASEFDLYLYTSNLMFRLVQNFKKSSLFLRDIQETLEFVNQ